jgi:hypothetical protein
MTVEISDKGLQLILDFEVGGGQKYYEKFCLHPDVPGGPDTQSGVTIGIGWDCGAHGHQDMVDQWQNYISEDDLAKLLGASGLKGNAAKGYLSRLKLIVVSWEAALDQFKTYTIPEYCVMTQKAFPGIDAAPACVGEALLSLVFNRGSSLQGPRRIEMRNIAAEVQEAQWAKIPSELRAMKRLWPDTTSLCERREAEAVYIETGLAP